MHPAEARTSQHNVTEENDGWMFCCRWENERSSIVLKGNYRGLNNDDDDDDDDSINNKQ